MASTSNLGIEKLNSSDYVSVDPINNAFDKLDELGDVYVKSHGKSGDWYYRLWGDGRYECWLARTQSGVKIGTAWGNLYQSTVASIPFPTSFSSAPHMTITYATTSGNTAFAVPNTGLSTSATGSILLCSPVSGATTTGVLSIHVSGSVA